VLRSHIAPALLLVLGSCGFIEPYVLVSMQLTARDMAVLTAPRCGVVSHSSNTKLTGTPYHTLAQSASVARCCEMCAADEYCEAFTFTKSQAGRCELFHAWGLSNYSSMATSGEPLSQWVVRPGTIEIRVGGSSTSAATVGLLTVTGTEKPLTDCPIPMPNQL
jgi:hypothetical protein